MRFWKYKKDLVTCEENIQNDSQEQEKLNETSPDNKNVNQEELTIPKINESETQNSDDNRNLQSDRQDEIQKNNSKRSSDQSSNNDSKDSEEQQSEIENENSKDNNLNNSSQDSSNSSKGESEESNGVDNKDTNNSNPSQDDTSSGTPEDSMSENEQLNRKENKNSNNPNPNQGENLLDSNKKVKKHHKRKTKKERLIEKRKKLEEARNKKREKLKKNKKQFEESYEKKYDKDISDFLDKLGELPSFDERNRDAGYSIDIDGNIVLPNSLIRTLITKFLNQRFCKRNTDLNIRGNSLEKNNGFYKWEIKDVIIHLETEQIAKVFDDKYGYDYENGKNENVPLSFYFDMSGSMSDYTNLLCVIAVELLKKSVKVLIGFNERVNVQIESIDRSVDVKTLSQVLSSAGYYDSSSLDEFNRTIKNEKGIRYKIINKNLDNYLVQKKAEKCVVFADFDPLHEVINLSNKAQVYWFCFESNFKKTDLNEYKGFIYKVTNEVDIVKGLVKVNEKSFKSLCYIDNPVVLQKVKR